MKRLLIMLFATAIAAPALAQHHGHHMPGMSMPKPVAKSKPTPKKPVAKKAVVKKVAPRAATKKQARPKRPAPASTLPMKAAPKAPLERTVQPADPHAGHHMPPPQPAATSPDPHAGHVVPPAADPHAGHQMPATETPQPPVAPPPAAAFGGPAHAADAAFDPRLMAEAREAMRKEHGAMTTHSFLVDRIEARIVNGRDGYLWDAQGWIGGDIHKLWVKTEGEGSFGRPIDQAEVQALWSHAIDPWFDLQLGARRDFRPIPQRTHLVLGVQGLAPYWFEIDAAAFLSNKGDVTVRLEAEYDQRITQKLILQPRVEFDVAAQDVPELGIGSGLSAAEAGLRLRYEFVPEFAPYVGVEYERAFGDTADLRRAAGDETSGWSLLIGLRTWF